MTADVNRIFDERDELVSILSDLLAKAGAVPGPVPRETAERMLRDGWSKRSAVKSGKVTLPFSTGIPNILPPYGSPVASYGISPGRDLVRGPDPADIDPFGASGPKQPTAADIAAGIVPFDWAGYDKEASD